jgi:hypothetical protein
MRSDHYRQYALECLRFAEAMHDPRTRAVLIDMAQAWIRLADRAARSQAYTVIAAAANSNEPHQDAG